MSAQDELITEQTAPERVTDEDLAEIERRIKEHDRRSVLGICLNPDLLVCLAAELRARRKEDAAIGRMLDEAGHSLRQPESISAIVKRLIGEMAEVTERADDAEDARDGQRARAEAAEQQLAALRAPVDVGVTMRALIGEILDQPADVILRAIKLHVEYAAVLAREAEGLRAEIKRVIRERDHAQANFESVDRNRDLVASDLATTRAELAKVVLERDAMAERLREGRAEIARLRADLARETARRDGHIAQLEQRLSELETELTQYRAAVLLASK